MDNYDQYFNEFIIKIKIIFPRGTKFVHHNSTTINRFDKKICIPGDKEKILSISRDVFDDYYAKLGEKEKNVTLAKFKQFVEKNIDQKNIIFKRNEIIQKI